MVHYGLHIFIFNCFLIYPYFFSCNVTLLFYLVSYISCSCHQKNTKLIQKSAQLLNILHAKRTFVKSPVRVSVVGVQIFFPGRIFATQILRLRVWSSGLAYRQDFCTCILTPLNPGGSSRSYCHNIALCVTLANAAHNTKPSLWNQTAWVSHSHIQLNYQSLIFTHKL